MATTSHSEVIMAKFPRNVYVRRDEDGNDSYLVALEKEKDVIDDSIDGWTSYGVYELVTTRKIRPGEPEVKNG